MVFARNLAVGCVDFLGKFNDLVIGYLNREVLFISDKEYFGLGGYLFDLFHPEMLKFFECASLV